MGLFGLGKKDKVIDLASSYNDEQKFNKARGKALQGSSATQVSSESSFAFLGNLASASGSSSGDYNDPNISVEERRKRLAKRLMDMTNKIEDLSNQVYHLQQRIELLEKKTRFTGSE